jgi:hypothetical protein
MSSRSARKHGLATTSRFNPAFAPWIEAIANPICPGTRDPLLLEQAQIIGATTCVLGVRAERMARMERLHNCMLRYTEHAPDFQLFGRTNPKSSPQGAAVTIGPVATGSLQGPGFWENPDQLKFPINAGKPEGMHLMIGRRPYAAFGNSTGDREMLEYEYTGAGDGARLMMLVLHNDAAREYAYGPAQGLPDTKVGTFTLALCAEAKKKGWTVISMKSDWNRIFAFDNTLALQFCRGRATLWRYVRSFSRSGILNDD